MLVGSVSPLAAVGRRLASRGFLRAPTLTRSLSHATAERAASTAPPFGAGGAVPLVRRLPGPLEKDGKPVELMGTVTRELFQRPRYNVYTFRAAGSSEFHTLVSKSALDANTFLNVRGRWELDSKYGWRVQVEAALPFASASSLLAHDASVSRAQPQMWPSTAAAMPGARPLGLAPQQGAARQPPPAPAQPAAPAPPAARTDTQPPSASAQPATPAAAAPRTAQQSPPAPAQPATPAPAAPLVAAPPAAAPKQAVAGASTAAAAAVGDTISGRLSSITFRSDDGFTIARVLLDAPIAQAAAPLSAAAALDRKRQPARSKTVVVRSASALASVAVGAKVRLTGQWTTHPKFGRQFDAWARGMPPTPTSREEALAMLAGGAIKGIGPAIAKRIVEALGEDAVGLLRNEAAAVERLKEVKGIGSASFAKIAQALAQHADAAGIASFCAAVGLSADAAIELHKRHGKEAERRVRENPYSLIGQLSGVSFQRADMVAAALRTPHGASCRLQAALCHALQRAATGAGHVYLPAHLLFESVRSLVAVPASSYTPQPREIAEALAALVEAGELRAELMDADTTESVSPDALRTLRFAGAAPSAAAAALAAEIAADADAEEAGRAAAAAAAALASGAPELAGGVRAAAAASASAAEAAAAAPGEAQAALCALGEAGADGRGLAAEEVAVYLPEVYDDELRLSRAIRARLTTLQRGAGQLRAQHAADAPPSSAAALPHEPADGDGGGPLAPPGSVADDDVLLGGAEAGPACASRSGAVLASHLTDEQRRAVQLATSGHRLVVLTGGPGTGKTRTVEHIVRLWQAAGKKVALACPTARGAAVLTELTGVQASTVHRLLGFNPVDHTFERSALDTVDADAIVVDEASMLDSSLAAGLLDALPLRCTLLLVGDADQLPSVGAGQVLRDILACPAVERVALRQVFRFDGSGEIALNAQLVNEGKMMAHLHYLMADEQPAPSEMRGCKLVITSSVAEAAEVMTGEVLSWVQRAGYDLHTDLQVLSPTKLGEAGSTALNKLLQARLNPLAAAHAAALPPGAKPQPIFAGDRVIQTHNDYTNNVFNGDVGRVVSADAAARKFTVAFRSADGGASKEARTLDYSFADLDSQISLAYALTVHKAQGSEYPVVVVPALPEHAHMLYRNLLYTAISRAKQLLIIVGSPRAVQACVGEDSRLRRLTRLTHLISTETKAIHEIDLDGLSLPDDDPWPVEAPAAVARRALARSAPLMALGQHGALEQSKGP